MFGKFKLYKCKGCDKDFPILSKGLCPRCYSLKHPLQKKYKLKKTNKTTRNIKEKEQLKNYYLYHLSKIKTKPFCENCGIKIQGSISNIAHILPKRKSANPEVMDNLNNYLYLCSPFDINTNDCHSKYDRIQTTNDVCLMICYSIAKKRYLTFNSNLRYNKYTKIFEEN